MSAVLERIRREARLRPRRLLLAEGADERILRAADRLAREKLAEVAIVGARDEVRATARRVDAALGGVEVLEAADDAAVARTAKALADARGDRLPASDRDRLARDPLFQAAARVRLGLADTFVAGATRTTADVLRAALWLIGTAPGVRSVSSFFLMLIPAGGATGEPRALLFSDCGVLPDPDAEQLAEIGCLAADSFERLVGRTPHVAFLSFSTRGSADHPKARKVREALALARARRPDRHFDGELQADAALVPEVARRKAPDSTVAGQADVLVFPDLDAGNIGYKLVERLGGASAYGPILQGLAKQANDLSRGCSADDVVAVSTIACALAGPARVDAGPPPAARDAGPAPMGAGTPRARGAAR